MNEHVEILVIDDDNNIGHLIKLYLEKEGYGVTCVQRGDDGLKAYFDKKPKMVVLDIMLPDIINPSFSVALLSMPVSATSKI